MTDGDPKQAHRAEHWSPEHGRRNKARTIRRYRGVTRHQVQQRDRSWMRRNKSSPPIAAVRRGVLERVPPLHSFGWSGAALAAGLDAEDVALPGGGDTHDDVERGVAHLTLAHLHDHDAGLCP